MPRGPRLDVADALYRTMDRMLVRGISKVLCVGSWNVIAFNVLRWFALAPIS
jgi:hypothetical protein